MMPTNNDNGNDLNDKKPVDHLRAFVTSVMDPVKKKEELPTGQESDQTSSKPFRGRDIAQDKGEDRTLKFILAGVGGVVVLVLLILGLSQKHVTRKPKPEPPVIGSVQQPQANGTSAPSTSIVPKTSMQPSPADNAKKGKLTARDLENTAGQKANAPISTTQEGASESRSLAQIPPFNAGQSSGETWSPKPYSGQSEQTNTQHEKSENAALAKPSLVFVANTTEASPSSSTNGSLVPSLGLGTGSRLSARLASVVTTAVDAPVIAVIEYSYEQNGDIVIPAGTKAVGNVRQGDRSGYVSIKFDHLEMPDKTVLPIDALATDRNLGPLKGTVTGTHTGRSFLVRSSTGLASAAAMIVGQNNSGGAISEDDLLRADVAQNIGRAGDQQVMQMMLAEHPIVTLSAGTDIYIIFEKAGEPTANGKTSNTARASQQNNIEQQR